MCDKMDCNASAFKQDRYDEIANEMRYTRMAAKSKDVSEESTTGMQRLRVKAAESELPFPAINVIDSTIQSKLDNVSGCMHSMPDRIKRTSDKKISGKRAFVCRCGYVGKAFNDHAS